MSTSFRRNRGRPDVNGWKARRAANNPSRQSDLSLFFPALGWRVGLSAAVGYRTMRRPGGDGRRHEEADVAEGNAPSAEGMSGVEQGRRRARSLLELEFGRAWDFDDPAHEWRRLFSVSCSARSSWSSSAPGGAVVNAQSQGAISRTAAVTAPWSHGDGHHPLHGRRLRRAPQSRREHRLRGSRRLPVAPCARLHHRAAARRHPRLSLPVGAPRQDRHARGDRAGPRDQRNDGHVHGAGPHRRPGEHDPGDRVGRPERGRVRRPWRRRLHHPRRPLVQSHQRRLDEPGPFVRARSGAARLHELLGLPRRTDRGRAHRGRFRVRPARVRVEAEAGPPRRRVDWIPSRPTQDKP